MNVFKEYFVKDQKSLIIVSFPRSGSNFVQNITAKTLRLRASSIYGKLSNLTRVYKSHALSKDWLDDEIERLITAQLPKNKVICLFRDPRDVFCSYFDFVQKRKGILISPEQFFDKVSFEYSMEYGTANTWDRKANFEPLSIWGAYKLHIVNWMEEISISNCDYIVYESLLNPQSKSWKTIFQCFDRPHVNPLEKYFEERVAQYGSSARLRGSVGSWREGSSIYTEIADVVWHRVNSELPQLLKLHNW